MSLRKFYRLFAPEDGSGAAGGGGAPAAAPAAPATLLSGDGGAAAGGAPAAPVAPAAPGFGSFIGADGAFNPGWLDALPPELRGNPALTTMPSLPDLAKSYVHTKSLVGTKLQPPDENSPPEKVAEWRKMLGVPDAPEGYGQLRPDDIPADQWDAESEKALTGLAHKHNIPPAALKEIVGLHAAMTKKGLESFAAAEEAHLEAEKGTLQKAWGAKFEENAGVALRFASMLGLKADDPIFRSAEVVQAMHRGASLFGGEKLITGTSPGVSGDINARIAAIHDPKSNDLIARQYRGEMGPEAQATAQATLHNLYQAQEAAAKSR